MTTTHGTVGALVAAMVLTTSIVYSPSALAGQKEDEQRAEEWVTMALAAYKGKRYGTAAMAFKEAHRLTPQPRLVWNIARCFEAAREWRDAKQWFAKFIAESTKKNPKYAEAQRRLKSVETELAAIDKKAQAQKLEEARNVELAATRNKEREIAAKAKVEREAKERDELVKRDAEFQKQLQEMRKAMAAQNRELVAKLEKAAAARRQAAAREAAKLGLMTQSTLASPPPQKESGMTTGGIVSLVLGAAAGGVGAFLYVNGQSLRDEWAEAVAAAENGVVTELTRKEGLELQDSANLQQTLGIAAIGVGSAVLLTGVILLAVGDPEPQTAVSTDISDSGFSLKLHGAF